MTARDPALVPELLVQSLDPSLAFWRDLCGFSVRYSRPDEGFTYLALSRCKFPVPESPIRPSNWPLLTHSQAAAWDDPYIDLLIDHPDDRDRLALPDHLNLPINALGPYRNRRSVGLFD